MLTNFKTVFDHVTPVTFDQYIAEEGGFPSVFTIKMNSKKAVLYLRKSK